MPVGLDQYQRQPLSPDTGRGGEFVGGGGGGEFVGGGGGGSEFSGGGEFGGVQVHPPSMQANRQPRPRDLPISVQVSRLVPSVQLVAAGQKHASFQHGRAHMCTSRFLPRMKTCRNVGA